MSEKIKEILETPDVPEKLKPENIPELLENVTVEKAETVRKKSIRKHTAWFTAAAACLIAVTGAVRINGYKNSFNVNTAMPLTSGFSASKQEEAACEEAASDSCETAAVPVIPENFAFVNIESYSQLYDNMKASAGNRRSSLMYDEEDIIAEENDVNNTDYSAGISDGITGTSPESEKSENEVYDTLSQVEGIAEADIIKANSSGVYFVTGMKVSYIPFDSRAGKFGEQEQINIAGDSGAAGRWTYIYDMYLTDDILTVISAVQDTDSYSYDTSTAVLTYDVSGGTPVFSGRGVQSGAYFSSRMKDEILYLVTNQYPDVYAGCWDDEYVFSENDCRDFAPFYGESLKNAECFDTSCIYIPRYENKESYEAFVNISGIDIHSPEEAVSSVAVAGNTDNIYCSADSIYISQQEHDEYWYVTDTVIARFSYEDGVITPAASGRAKGYVLNQFSMDEYNGYFRVATTSSEMAPDAEDTWDRVTENNLFVFDKDMNQVGSVTEFAETESVKSVNFNGDTAYVVTYERTDPLFAIDLSSPSSPVITDEYKINGYSSFIWKWSKDLLVGFGVEADDNAVETGVKLVMFDVSDNGNLDECGTYSMNGDSFHSVFSAAVYDRKALLVSPEKNLIGFPLTERQWSYGFETGRRRCYIVFEYKDGQFMEKGQIRSSDEYDFERGIYIGDYLCVFSVDEAVSVNIENMNETDRIKLVSADNYMWID